MLVLACICYTIALDGVSFTRCGGVEGTAGATKVGLEVSTVSTQCAYVCVLACTGLLGKLSRAVESIISCCANIIREGEQLECWMVVVTLLSSDNWQLVCYRYGYSSTYICVCLYR